MIKIIVVGKLTQKYLNAGIEHYEKQIKHKISWIEVPDEASETGIDEEGERILKHLSQADYVIALSIQGLAVDSPSFAKKIDHLLTYMQKDIVFVIGGSHGLSKKVYQRADEEISFSKMTFPHQLMRLILIEQIYRALMILKNHPYHK